MLLDHLVKGFHALLYYVWGMLFNLIQIVRSGIVPQDPSGFLPNSQWHTFDLTAKAQPFQEVFGCHYGSVSFIR
jgi:hypothetical protein